MNLRYPLGKLLLTIGALPLTLLSAAEQLPIHLTSKDQPLATIVVEANAPKFTRAAAEELADTIHKISGAKPGIVDSTDKVQTATIIWVGPHHELAERQGSMDLSLSKPEETLIQTAGKDIVIIGRDRVAKDGTVLEAGTHHAVYSFIEGQLGVRWLWPGHLGTDIPKNREILIDPVSIRYTPQIRLRRFNMTHYERSYVRGLSKESRAKLSEWLDNPREWAKQMDRATLKWLNAHRSDDSHLKSGPPVLAGSMYHYRNRHAFGEWYERYGKTHPEWFALQPDGTRTPYPSKDVAKLCVSNPGIAEQWLKNAREFFERNPHATTFEAAENDKGWEGYCLCENCLAIDNKDAELLERPIRWRDKEAPFYALTNRYVKFWNAIAKRLREEFPDRDVNVSVYAYHVTRPAPTIKLEPNIIPAFVGIERRFYQRNSQKHTLDQRRMWKEWWDAAGNREMLVWRPNIFFQGIGLPYIFTKRHAENMHFMADHGLAGVVFNSNYSYWAIQAPQLYLVAKLLWDPKADKDVILADYYQRGFGPAAPYIAAYFQNFEDLYTRLAEQYEGQPYFPFSDAPRLFREIRNDSLKATGRLGQEGVVPNRDVEERAQALLDKATASVANSEQIFRERVEFIKVGFAFIQSQLDAIETTNEFNKNPTDENRARAVAAAEKRADLIENNAGGFAINTPHLLINLSKSEKYLGPPKEKPEAKSHKETERLLIQADEA